MSSQTWQWGNLALAFGLELCALVAFAAWGAHIGASTFTSILFGITAPVLAALLWGLFAAPHASLAAPGITTAVKVAFFVTATLALYSTGRPGLAAGFLVLVVVNNVLLHLIPPSAAPTPGPASSVHLQPTDTPIRSVAAGPT